MAEMGSKIHQNTILVSAELLPLYSFQLEMCECGGSVETVVTLIELSSSLLLKTTTTASSHVGIVHFGAVVFGAFEVVIFSTVVLTDVDEVIVVGWGGETFARINSNLTIKFTKVQPLISK